MSDLHKPVRRVGRPKSQATQDKEQDARDAPRIAKLLANPPQLAKHSGVVLGVEWLNLMDQERAAIEDAYVVGTAIPPERAYLLESVYHESVSDEQRTAVLKWYAGVLYALREGQSAGGRTTKRNADKRAVEVCVHNTVLIDHYMKPRSHGDLTRVAQKIHREWHKIPPGGRMVGESPLMTRRGVGQPEENAPSIKTIGRYLQKVITLADKAPSK